jgi:hypothetical protein
MEFPKDRRPGLNGDAVDNVVHKDRSARPGIERQGASKIAAQIHRASRPAVHIDPSCHDTIAAAEVEQEPSFSAVRAGTPSPSQMESTSDTDGPENYLPLDLLCELDRDRRPLDKLTNGVPAAHRTSEVLGQKKNDTSIGPPWSTRKILHKRNVDAKCVSVQ